ncbi:MAG: polyketide cyclase [Rhodospirillaceae bacterium]|nr:polyketide cyclase [Rhodospirillaceae bacterium]
MARGTPITGGIRFGLSSVEPNPYTSALRSEATVMTSTEIILDHHLDCFSKGDLKGLLSDYTENTVLETPTGQITGLKTLRKVFASLVTEFGKGESTFNMARRSVSGNHAFIFWRARTEDNEYHVGTDTFYIVDGKIAYQTFAGHITPRT